MNLNNESKGGEAAQSAAQLKEEMLPAGLDDDLDFSDVKLGTRQADASQEIVCEGGCE